MLEQILAFIHNWFYGETQAGEFGIAAGRLTGCTLNLLDGQRIQIRGSVFSDGVWTWREHGPLCDSDGNSCGMQPAETFKGRVTAMRVPPALIKLSTEIKDWCEANEKALNSPLQSESFNGYSYTKGTASEADGGVYGWKTQFASSLNAWRKIG